MSDEKPEESLNHRVARALGKVPCDRWEVWGQGIAGTEWYKKEPCDHDCYPDQEPPRYDTDWAVVGPLIEKYDISISRDGTWQDNPQWVAVLGPVLSRGSDPCGSSGHDTYFDVDASGATPLIAVCNLILALKEAGKL